MHTAFDVIGQDDICQYLQRALDEHKTPHAQLFVGPEGCGMLQVALWYAKKILCEKGSGYTDDQNCTQKCEHLAHPDLHFIFPTTNNSVVRSHAISANFMNEWREFLRTQPYGNLLDWYKGIGIENKQGQIGVDEIQDAVKKLTLKPYESTYKVMLVWMADKMNTVAANKMLKIIEEPPEKTILILLTEHESQIMDTVRSRCQVLYFRRLKESVVQQTLENRGIRPQKALQIAHRCEGNLNKAFDMLNDDSDDLTFGKWFVALMRIAFSAKKNKTSIIPLMKCCEEVAKQGRETQKSFLVFCIAIFRQAMLKNYGAQKIVYIDTLEDGFSLDRFAPFVHNKNILEITSQLEQTRYHIERNGNSKILFSDLAIHLTRLLHLKEEN